MAVFTEENVKANIRNQGGRRVFFLAEGDHLTPSAREWLRKERIEVLSGMPDGETEYRTLSGALLREKPEHMTHLRTGILVPKDHPRIRFRGMMDHLEAQLLLAARLALTLGEQKAAGQIKELLSAARMVIRCEVLEEPIPIKTLCGLSMDQLREQSHRPERYFGQPHFMPEPSDSQWLLQLNLLRTCMRQAELAACDAFRDRDGSTARSDIILLLNRMSSLLWILMIQRKKEETYG